MFPFPKNTLGILDVYLCRLCTFPPFLDLLVVCIRKGLLRTTCGCFIYILMFQQLYEEEKRQKLVEFFSSFATGAMHLRIHIQHPFLIAFLVLLSRFLAQLRMIYCDRSPSGVLLSDPASVRPSMNNFFENLLL